MALLNWAVVIQVGIKSIKMAAVRWDQQQLKHMESRQKWGQEVCVCVRVRLCVFKQWVMTHPWAAEGAGGEAR